MHEHATAPTVPTVPDEAMLALAEHKLGSASSDLDGFLSDLKSFESNITVEAFLARSPDRADAVPLPEPDEIARVVAYAAGAVEDARRFGEDAAKLLDRALVLYEDARNERGDAGRTAQLFHEWAAREAAWWASREGA